VDITKGMTVTVVRGKKVPVGTTGEVIWTGIGQYGPRLGVKDAAGTVHWTAASNVDPVTAAPVAAVNTPGVAEAPVDAGKIAALEARIVLLETALSVLLKSTTTANLAVAA